ncbi:hypothetical protein, partial [Nocardia transvalensis]|uniref:hypothetical protein n=1 Tax=Nocardia transvalensis TaxID=37333 RepID=UPI0005932C9F
MIPEAVEVFDAIPLTANGKLDRAAVRRAIDADAPGSADAYVAPADEVEAAIAYIAGQILGVDQVGVETDFFEIGGNSIM